MTSIPFIPAAGGRRETYLNVAHPIRSWLLTRDHKRIALLYLITITVLFFVGGTGQKQILIRGIGPTLAQYDVTNALADPQVLLFNGSQSFLASNDNWGGGATLITAYNKVGAFALPDSASKDSAILVTLNPGAYTVVVQGVNNATGIAVVEVYA